MPRVSNNIVSEKQKKIHRNRAENREINRKLRWDGCDMPSGAMRNSSRKGENVEHFPLPVSGQRNSWIWNKYSLRIGIIPTQGSHGEELEKSYGWVTQWRIKGRMSPQLALLFKRKNSEINRGEFWWLWDEDRKRNISNSLHRREAETYKKNLSSPQWARQSYLQKLEVVGGERCLGSVWCFLSDHYRKKGQNHRWYKGKILCYRYDRDLKQENLVEARQVDIEDAVINFQNTGYFRHLPSKEWPEKFFKRTKRTQKGSLPTRTIRALMIIRDSERGKTIIELSTSQFHACRR